MAVQAAPDMPVERMVLEAKLCWRIEADQKTPHETKTGPTHDPRTTSREEASRSQRRVPSSTTSLRLRC